MGSGVHVEGGVESHPATVRRVSGRGMRDMAPLEKFLSLGGGGNMAKHDDTSVNRTAL